jgi:choice-of-anchor B domain-containing protein
MKKLFFLLLVALCATAHAQSPITYEMNFLGRWDDDNLPVASPDYLQLQYSGCWGLDLNGREYAVVGGAEHVLFFDVTDPAQPELIGKFAGTANTVWREFKSYKNRIYAVSDGTVEGLMIFDMSQAPDTVVRTYWSNEFFEKAHTITLDTTSGRIYLNGGSATQGIIVLDVSQNPDVPTFITHATFAGGLLHDSYVRNDTIYASSGNQGYYVYDMRNPLNPVLLASISTGGYNHNSWLNPEGTYAYYTEEVPAGLPIRIIDLQHLAQGELEIAGSFLDKFSTDNGQWSAIPHNVYIRDHILFNSQYEDGLIAYDISNPTQPVQMARYDTHPQNNVYNGYRGNWGNYPWLPSGNIIAADMQNGLYMLKLSPVTSGIASPEKQLEVAVSPNPASGEFRIRWKGEAPNHWQWVLRAPAGGLVSSGQGVAAQETTVSLAGQAAGLYFLEIRDDAGRVSVRKVVVE